MIENMTLRDYFAAKAMQAMIQARATLPEEDQDSFAYAVAFGVGAQIRLQNGDKDPPENFTWAELLCVESYEIADAMLKARTE